MNEIIITGSTGVIGHRAVREILAAGYGVTGVTRSTAGRERLESLGTALTAEHNARELFGRDTVVLRFGLFIGPDSGSSRAALEAARAGASIALGPPGAYRPTLWLDDVAAAIAAALRVPAGTYNVADTDPATNAEIDTALAAAVGVGTLRTRAPQEGPLARSQRVSNRRLRDASGWAPTVRAATESWVRIVADR